jgi:hypothetical protein
MDMNIMVLQDVRPYCLVCTYQCLRVIFVSVSYHDDKGSSFIRNLVHIYKMTRCHIPDDCDI